MDARSLVSCNTHVYSACSMTIGISIVWCLSRSDTRVPDWSVGGGVRGRCGDMPVPARGSHEPAQQVNHHVLIGRCRILPSCTQVVHQAHRDRGIIGGLGHHLLTRMDDQRAQRGCWVMGMRCRMDPGPWSRIGVTLER
jgi:hypothetical protein